MEPAAHRLVVLVDDDNLVVRTAARFLKTHGYDTLVFGTAQEALDELSQLSPFAIVADLHMPGMNGAELLSLARTCAPAANRILLTAESEVATLARTMPIMVAHAVVPKTDLQKSLPLALERMRRDGERLTRHTEAIAVATGMVRALQARHITTVGEVVQLSHWTRYLAQQYGLSEEQIREAELGALLHDVGKLGLPDEVLFPGHRPSPQQQVALRRHTEIGVSMLQDSSLLRGGVEIVGHHHERWDASGYPAKLNGEAIPIKARIFAAVAGYASHHANLVQHGVDAHRKACEALRNEVGRYYDPRVVEALLSIPRQVWTGS